MENNSQLLYVYLYNYDGDAYCALRNKGSSTKRLNVVLISVTSLHKRDKTNACGFTDAECSRWKKLGS